MEALTRGELLQVRDLLRERLSYSKSQIKKYTFDQRPEGLISVWVDDVNSISARITKIETIFDQGEKQ